EGRDKRLWDLKIRQSLPEAAPIGQLCHSRDHKDACKEEASRQQDYLHILPPHRHRARRRKRPNTEQTQAFGLADLNTLLTEAPETFLTIDLAGCQVRVGLLIARAIVT